MFGAHNALVKALGEACRWKTALNAANKGARRKSAQARRLRGEATALRKELDWCTTHSDEASETLRQTERTLHDERGVIVALKKELVDSRTCETMREAETTELLRELEHVRETDAL